MSRHGHRIIAAGPVNAGRARQVASALRWGPRATLHHYRTGRGYYPVYLCPVVEFEHDPDLPPGNVWHRALVAASIVRQHYHGDVCTSVVHRSGAVTVTWFHDPDLMDRLTFDEVEVLTGDLPRAIRWRLGTHEMLISHRIPADEIDRVIEVAAAARLVGR